MTVIRLLLLKHIFALSDEEVAPAGLRTDTLSNSPARSFPARVAAQALGPEPWHNRLGDKLDRLLTESLRVAHEAGAL